MANSNLTSLPPSILHKILSMCTESVRDHGAARIAFRGFNEVGREDHFYRSANLLYLNDWIWEWSAVRTFRLRSFRMGNPEAINLRGMCEFFLFHMLEEGRRKIRLAGERGCELAKYVDTMLELAFTVDERGRVHNYPSDTRAYVYRMLNMITIWQLVGHLDYEKPAKFLEVMGKIDANTVFDCPCFREELMWRCDRFSGSITRGTSARTYTYVLMSGQSTTSLFFVY